MQPPQMLDLIVPVGEEPYGTYQITIDKADGTRVMQIHRIARDSNKELRFGLNSSAFGPGDYVLKFEGYTTFEAGDGAALPAHARAAWLC